MRNCRFNLWTAATAAILTGVLFVGCGNAEQRGGAAAGGNPDAAANAAILPNADLVFRANLAGMRDSEMYRRLDALAEQRKDGQNNDRIEQLDQFSTHLEELTGMTKDDVREIVASVSFENVEFGADGPQSMDGVKAVMAAVLEKPLSADLLEQAAKKSAAADAADAVTVTRHNYKGVPVITVTSVDEADAAMSLAMANDDRVLFAGTDAELKGALDRLAGAAPAGSAAAIDAPDAGLRLQFTLPPDLRDTIRTAAQQPQDAPGNQAAAMAETMQHLETITLDVAMQQNMDVALTAFMGTEANARQLKSMLDNQILSLVRLSIQMMAGGQPLHVLESLSTRQDAGQVRLSFTLTPSDLDVFQQASQQWQNGGGAPHNHGF